MSEFDEFLIDVNKSIENDKTISDKLDIINKKINNCNDIDTIIDSENFPKTVWDDIKNKSRFQKECMLLCAVNRNVLY